MIGLRPARVTASPEVLPDGPYTELLAAASGAPYLAGLIARRPQMAADLAQRGPDAVVRDAIDATRALGDDRPFEAVMAELRHAKAAVHLAVAAADLAQVWTLDRVTHALSDFADAALDASVRAAATLMRARGELGAVDADDPRGAAPGLILLAMGKHGARELNYSSDIDVTVFFDRATLPAPPGGEAQRTAVRLAQLLVRAMEEITVDGYVFRTDLRLRPDPGATPIAVSLAAAEIYYQTLGQNWERAAFIKARPCAGDKEAGALFLQGLESFLWRRHLDYAAIADIQSIKRQIRAVKGGAELDDPVFDVKLGRGGIRDIELFAQTQQLILGGRDRNLRASTTLGALDALVETGRLDPADRDVLARCYVFYRGVEHRVQMLADAQTHRVPADADERARVAALAGFDTREAFEAALVEARHAVAAIDARLFAEATSLADPIGSLVFTGVEDDAETLRTLSGLGFTAADRVSQTIRGWHHGRIRAMRSERARELLTALTPRLLRALAATGEPDLAFDRFAEFFAALPAGVQPLSAFAADPRLLEQFADVLVASPRMGAMFGRQPALLDALADARAERVAGDGLDLIAAACAEAPSFEAALNAVRRAQREEAVRIDVQVLTARLDPDAAGAAHADLAEACVRALAGVAEREIARRFGPPPGRYAVLALGKFGGRELAHGSDLDIMLVFDAPEGSGAAEYYARLTQRLITALSAPTEEGGLYEVDMQLRPSGSKGPVAVRLSSFARYYEDEAWTWELLALTRLRPVAGDGDLGREALAVAHAALARPRDRAKTFADVAAMRARLDRDRPGKSPWDLKLAPGGLVDIEFIAQAFQLVAGEEATSVIDPNTGRALAALAKAGHLPGDAAETLSRAWALYSRLQHWLRIVMDKGVFDPARAGEGLRAKLAAVADAPDLAALEDGLRAHQGGVRNLFLDLVGASDGDAPLAR